MHRLLRTISILDPQTRLNRLGARNKTDKNEINSCEGIRSLIDIIDLIFVLKETHSQRNRYFSCDKLFTN